MYVCIYVYIHTQQQQKIHWGTNINGCQPVPSLEADLFFIKINCVAGAAYLSMPPADTSVPLLQQQCECVSVWCVSMLSNNGSVIRHCRRHMNESEGNSDQKSACSQETQKFILWTEIWGRNFVMTCFHKWNIVSYTCTISDTLSCI